MTGLHRPVVAIVGAGFGGLNAARRLQDQDLDVVLIDKNNYHLFQPLLYQVATAALSPTDIAYPVRAVFQKQKNFNFWLAQVNRVDIDSRCLDTSGGQVNFDYLILAPGGQTNFFGLDRVAEYGFELKDLDDAEAIRNHILWMFERAAHETDEELCDALRTFVIVGAGPTGVECAGALSELIRLVLRKDYPAMRVSDVHVIILEALGQLLPGFPDELGAAALKTLRKKHVEVRLNSEVADFDGNKVTLRNGEIIPAYSLIWAAGVRAAKLMETVQAPQGKQGRVVVEPTLQLAGHPEIFVIGDAAYLESDGKPLPMMAPVAIQQARVAAENIKRSLAGEDLIEFMYKDPGKLATIGRNAAVARVKTLKFHGFLAWIIWLAVHIFWLIGFRNRLLVLVNWAWDYLFYDRAVRLITPSPKKTPEPELTR